MTTRNLIATGLSLALLTLTLSAAPKILSVQPVGQTSNDGAEPNLADRHLTDFVSAISDSGQLAGGAYVPGKPQWYSFDEFGPARELPFHGARPATWAEDGTNLVAYDLPDGDRALSTGRITCINEFGAFAGFMRLYTSNPVTKEDLPLRDGIFYSNGDPDEPLQEIPFPGGVLQVGGDFAEVFAINSGGIIIGDYTVLDNFDRISHPFRFDTNTGQFDDLTSIIATHFGAVFRAGKTQLVDINDAGEIIGAVRHDSDGTAQAFRIDQDQLTVLGDFFPSAINNNGDVVGHHRDGTGVIFRQNTLTPIPLPPGNSQISPRDINDHGDIVAQCVTIIGNVAVGEPCLLRDGAVHRLPELAAPFLASLPSSEISSIERALKINNSGLILASAHHTLPSGHIGERFAVIQLADTLTPIVQDASRLGNPIASVPGATVIARVGTEFIDAADTDALGRLSIAPADAFEPNSLALDPARLYDFEVKKGDLVRLYRNVRARDVADGTVQLVLPVRLHQLLDQQLTNLEQTGALVGAYNTSQARELIATWNSTAPENLPQDPVTHADRDIALARLLTATDALASLYASAEPLCLDIAKLITNTITSVLAFQKAAATIQAEAATVMQQLGSESGAAAFVIDFAISALATSLKVIAANLQLAFVTALKTFAPAPVTTLVNSSLSITIATVLGGMAKQGAWDATAGVKGGRAALLESLISIAGEQVGGRIFASAYVASTQLNLDLATVRARNLQGEGTVSDAYRASQQVVIDASIAVDQALLASSLIADTTKKWGQVASVSQLVGRIPAAQIFALMAQAIRGLNITLTAATAVNDTIVYTRIREDDAVNAPLLAFDPTLAPPAPLNAKTSKKPSKATAKSAATPLFPAYSDSLASLPAAITSADLDATVSAGTALIANDPELAARITSALLCAESLARSASPRRPDLDVALTTMRTAATAIDTARSDLYLALASLAVPGFADPAPAPATVIDLVNATTDAIATFENAAANAAAEASGLTSPPSPAVASHGIAQATLDNRIPPGPFTLTATVTNTGSQPAENVTATTSPAESTTPLPAWQPTSPTSQNLGTLAPGESRTLTWDATATDTSPDGQNSAAVYQITLTADNAPTETATGGFEITTPNTRFNDWVTSFTGTESAPAFTDDPDHDGANSGRERFLGRHPGSTDSADLELVDGHLRHPRAAAPGTDATATYLWSLDLDTWNPSGVESDGVSVTLEPAVVAGQANANKTIELTPTITGDPANLFFRLDVTPLPDAPPPPDPVPPLPPTITSQPEPLALFAGNAAFFHVTVDSEDPVLYQWQKNATDIPGATARDFNIDTVTAAHAGTYTVRVTAPGGSVTSNPAQLDVDSGGGGT